MKRMQLSAAESGGIKVGGAGPSRSTGKLVQAVGKVLAERLVNAEGVAQALGRIWCPIKGVSCKDLGENHLLFTFHQASGKRRAMEDGPWMFGKDLVIVVDYDETKTLEEMTFAFIPIWVRISKLPFGMMNRVMGEAIGGKVGEFMEMDEEEDGTTVGRFLRVKVRLDIRKPLMRGIMVHTEGKDGEEKPIWCPMAYEFLPDFCYTCGRIGHTDKVCDTKLMKGEVQQFSKALRFIPDKRRVEDGGGERSFVNKVGWRQRGSGSRGSWGSGGRLSSQGMGSDAPSWKKTDRVTEGKELKGPGEEEEVSSPAKKKEYSTGDGDKATRALVLEKRKEVQGKDLDSTKLPGVNSSMQPMQIELVKEVSGEKEQGEGKTEVKKKGTYKKISRAIEGKDTTKPTQDGSKKRSAQDELMVEAEGSDGRREKGGEVATNKRSKTAGLADQSCGSQ